MNAAEPALADTSIGAIAGGSGSGSSDTPMPKPTESLAPEQRSIEESLISKTKELGIQDQDAAESNAVENKLTENKATETKPTEINPTENNINESNTAEKNIDNAESKKTENEDELRPPPHNKDVSEEALKGPQGPAPKPAEQFEKEEKMKQKKPAESRSSGDSKF